jgi:hypothetical protein
MELENDIARSPGIGATQNQIPATQVVMPQQGQKTVFQYVPVVDADDIQDSETINYSAEKFLDWTINNKIDLNALDEAQYSAMEASYISTKRDREATGDDSDSVSEEHARKRTNANGELEDGEVIPSSIPTPMQVPGQGIYNHGDRLSPAATKLQTLIRLRDIRIMAQRQAALKALPILDPKEAPELMQDRVSKWNDDQLRIAASQLLVKNVNTKIFEIVFQRLSKVARCEATHCKNSQQDANWKPVHLPGDIVIFKCQNHYFDNGTKYLCESQKNAAHMWAMMLYPRPTDWIQQMSSQDTSHLSHNIWKRSGTAPTQRQSQAPRLPQSTPNTKVRADLDRIEELRKELMALHPESSHLYLRAFVQPLGLCLRGPHIVLLLALLVWCCWRTYVGARVELIVGCVVWLVDNLVSASRLRKQKCGLFLVSV